MAKELNDSDPSAPNGSHKTYTVTHKRDRLLKAVKNCYLQITHRIREANAWLGERPSEFAS